MKKKKKKQHEMVGRRTWEMSPVQQTIPNKKRYNRKKQKSIQDEGEG